MREIEVFKLHRTDIVGVRNLNLVLVGLGYGLTRFGICVGGGSYTGFGAVSGLCLNGLGKDILLVEQHLKCAADFVNRPLATVESRYCREQNIGVVFDLV